jgi:hypothetical protein
VFDEKKRERKKEKTQGSTTQLPHPPALARFWRWCCRPGCGAG